MVWYREVSTYLCVMGIFGRLPGAGVGVGCGSLRVLLAGVGCGSPRVLTEVTFMIWLELEQAWAGRYLGAGYAVAVLVRWLDQDQMWVRGCPRGHCTVAALVGWLGAGVGVG